MTPSQKFTGFLIRLFMAAIVLCAPATTAAADTARDLQYSVYRLNIWLGQDENADSWRRYLSLNLLESQAAKGNQADVLQLQDILNRFSSNSNGLDALPFNDVRLALQSHINQLSQTSHFDLPYSIAQARMNYRQISIDQLQRRRDKAIYDLLLLKKYYKQHLYSRERALVYYDLQLDQLIEFLEGIQFELPPDISVGKLNDQMSAVRAKLDELEQQRDQLPEVEEIPVDPPQPDNNNQGVPIEPPGAPAPVASANQQTNTKSVTNDQENQDDQISDDEARRQRQILGQEIDRLTQNFDQIKQLRDEVRRSDAGRQRQRAATWRELRTYTRNFIEVGKRRSDYYFASSYYSFSKFALLYFFGTDDNLQADYYKQLDDLQQDLELLARTNDRVAAARIGNSAGWLEATELAPGLLTAIKRQHSSPNLKISVSSNLANQLAPGSMRETLAVNEIMFGRLIRGTASTDSRVTVEFVDDPNQALISIRLLGTLNSVNHTQTGPITAYAGANGSYEARRNIAASVGGFSAGDSYVAATIKSQLNDVSSNLNLIKKIANKTFLRDRQRNEAESARRLEIRVSDQFNDQTNDVLSQGKIRVADLLQRAGNYGSYVPELYMRTTNDRLYVIGHKSSFGLVDTGRVSNLGSSTMDLGSSVKADVAIQLHESLVSNYLDPFVVNRTFTNDELAQLAKDLTGDEPPALATDVEAGDEPWSITLAQFRPIQVEFENNIFTVTVTGRRFSQGDTRIQAGLTIRIPFKIKTEQGKLVLSRDGDASIDYVEPERKNARIVAFKSFLETKLNSTKQNGRPAGLELPANLIPAERVEALKDNEIVEAMNLSELRMINGWLYLGWNYQPMNSMTMRASDTPAIWTEFSSAPNLIDSIPTDDQPPPTPQETPKAFDEIRVEGDIEGGK